MGCQLRVPLRLSGGRSSLRRSDFPNLPGLSTPAVRRQLAILRRPALSAHLLLSAVLFAAMFATYTHLAVWLEHVAGFGGGAVGVALLSFGAAGFAGNWAAGRLADRHPTVATAVVAAVLAVMNAALPLAGSVSSLLPPVLATWGAAHAAAFVLCQIRVMAVGDGAPAFASSLNISARNAGIAFGAAAGGWLIERHGIAMMGFGGTALAGGALLLAFLLARSAVRRSAGGGHPFHQCR